MGWWQETYEELGGITAEEWLRREYGERPTGGLSGELGLLLGRSLSHAAIRNKAKDLALKKTVGYKPTWWVMHCGQLGGLTPEDWLRREYPHRPNRDLTKDLSRLLGRTIGPTSLQHKAYKLGIGKIVPEMLVPTFIDHENVSGRATISGDFHIPLHDTKLVEKMVYVSQKMNSKQLIIAGDLYNFDAFSTFVHEPTYLQGEELDYGEKLLDYLAEWYDFILVLMGNHEERLYKRKLDKHIDWKRLSRMLHRHEDKIKFSKYGYCVLNDTWRVTHPKNYSQIKTRVANRIALKHRQHVLNFHGHALSIAHDDSGHQIIADGGGLFDEKKIEYRMIKDSTYPAWATGFWVITEDNELHGFNDLFTPWRFYEKAWGALEGE